MYTHCYLLQVVLTAVTLRQLLGWQCHTTCAALSRISLFENELKREATLHAIKKFLLCADCSVNFQLDHEFKEL